jgi:dUTP pyrophosphatase
VGKDLIMVQEQVTLKVKKLHPDAILPQYQSAGAACFDLHVVRRNWLSYDASSDDTYWPLLKGASVIFSTGLAVEVPEGYVLLIYSRSGHGFKNGVRLANCVGVIDSDYRGELLVKLVNEGDASMVINKWDRIAQAMLIPIPQVHVVEVESLSETIRGEEGFGSTGAQ